MTLGSRLRGSGSMKSQMCMAMVAVALGAPLSDLQRARTKVPGLEYKGSFFQHMTKVLNGHLRKAHPQTKPCHEWTADALQELQGVLFQHKEHTHDKIYRETKDNRALRFDTLEEHQSAWRQVSKAAKAGPLLQEMQRDGHCHETVMWYVHHVPEVKKQFLQHLVLPELPLVEWMKPNPEDGMESHKVYDDHYHPSSTCQACHAGGVPWQDNDGGPNGPQPPPLPRQVNGNDRKRRCDEWFGDAEGGKCRGCDGTGGAYYGNSADESFYPACELVLKPEDVPPEQRTPGAFPKDFVVQMRGADRWPRASPGTNASCGYTTDCSTVGEFGNLSPPGQTSTKHWYATIHNTIYVSEGGGHFGGGRVRHECVYEGPNGRDGAARALTGQYGSNQVHVSAIHQQSVDAAKKFDPTQILTTHHVGWDKRNASGHDDSKDDWRRIPSDGDGKCICVPDPAGLPDFHGAFSNATYLGRLNMEVLFQETGTGGPPVKTPVLVDQYVKWNFHLFVSVKTKLPVMFSSPYGGQATYGNWSIKGESNGGTDAFWPEWRTDPKLCLDVLDADTCRLKGPSPKRWGTIAAGLIEGLLSDGQELKDCLVDGVTTLGDDKTGLKDILEGTLKRNLPEVADGLRKLADGLDKMLNAKKECAASAQEVKGIIAVLRAIHGLKNLTKHVVGDFVTNFKDILTELGAAAKAFKVENYEVTGRELGMALHRIVIGEPVDIVV